MFGRRRELAPNWQGGRRDDGRYFRILVADSYPHPASVTPEGKWAYEHRILAERALGRYLTSAEIVHHIDGNGHNNEPANLLLLPNNAAHRRMHAKH